GDGQTGFGELVARAALLIERRSMNIESPRKSCIQRRSIMANIAVTKKDSVFDQLEQLHRRIANRAYDLFRGRDGWGDAIGDWLSAEQELVWRPAVEVSEHDGTLKIEA